MITLLGMQLLAVAACAVLLGVPGWTITRLLELDRHVPTVALPAAWFTFGLAAWTAALVPTLALAQPWWVTLTSYGVLAVVLLACARVRERRRGHAKAPWEAVGWWTIGGIAASVLLAAVLRTRLAFDSLFHIGLVRRLLELPDPAFDNLDRILGLGVNPSYAVPTWQALLASVAGVTHLDPATVVEAMSMLAVLVAACAAGGLGRVVSGSVAGEVAGVAAYAWLRVYFPRRELEGDGVAYAALPGNLALDVLLPMALVASVLLLAGDRSGRRPLMALGGAAAGLVVLVHANYVVYLAVIGVGTVAWLALLGPWGADVRRGAVRALVAIAVPAGLVLAGLLPVLLLLDQFGDPMEQRFDYHQLGSGAWRIVRPGHLYDSFGAGGLLATLALPWATWRARGVARALLGGGALAIFAVAFVPPLRAAMDATGSLTLGLRLPRPFGTLLIAGLAVALPDLVGAVARHGARLRAARGRIAAAAAVLLPLLAIAAAAALYGYPQARRDPAELGADWPAILGVAGLLGVTLVLARHRRSRVDGPRDVPAAYAVSPRTMGLAALAIGVCLLPSGITSLRRGAWQSRQLVAAVRADDLGCAAGIQRQLRRVPAGDVVLADPVTGYVVQALAPGRLVADFKVWNGSTDTARIRRRIELLEDAFASSSPRTAGRGLDRLVEAYDARWVVVATGTVEPPLESTLGDFDATGLRDELADGAHGARRVASGAGHLSKYASDEERAACDLELWRLDTATGGPG